MVDMEMDMTLAEHLAALNAEKLAWMAAGPDRWTGLWTEDLAHWAELGVHTVEDFKRHDLIQLIWDMHKDVTGCRPRHMDFESMSLADLQQEADYLGSQIEAEIEREQAYMDHLRDLEMECEAAQEAWLAEQPEPIDYVAANYQEGWL